MASAEAGNTHVRSDQRHGQAQGRTVAVEGDVRHLGKMAAPLASCPPRTPACKASRHQTARRAQGLLNPALGCLSAKPKSVAVSNLLSSADIHLRHGGPSACSCASGCTVLTCAAIAALQWPGLSRGAPRQPGQRIQRVQCRTGPAEGCGRASAASASWLEGAHVAE